eukprot:CAMPEP_0201583296 /NCGR_PEP_ID=MMETSP0190_2-20130828/97034_1 /ASSEMBLY_ACC=CAM_ASM_000263 /TAXON_ID=37353 /ORGANISM="Rosalina sp." /LENGTH=85 /DNA_ID=CAMNT_0048024943 /DNA_START=63 /DNA_END=317 /DNA_ORIENTATION=-
MTEKPQYKKEEHKSGVDENETLKQILLPVGWGPWICGNGNGDPRTQVGVAGGTTVFKLLAMEQGGYGIVNIGIACGSADALYESW